MIQAVPMMSSERQPEWAVRMESRLDRLEQDVHQLREGNLEARVSTLEKVIDEKLWPMLTKMAAKLDAAHWTIKIIGGGMGFVLIALQIYSIVQG